MITIQPAVPKLPPIPPKTREELFLASDDIEHRQKWFYVKSPREIFGAVGPNNIIELKKLHHEKIIQESTLIWAEGQSVWQALIDVPDVAKEVLGIKTADYVVPDFEPKNGFITHPLGPVHKFQVDMVCVRCGNQAMEFCANNTEQIPELAGLRNPVGAPPQASEIIPGFLWIGNSSTGKSR